MWKEILRIIPSMSTGDLNKMVGQLNGRFANVAKKFGKGLSSAIIGGGLIGLAVGLGSIFSKLLNPLKEIKETQEAIERSLQNASDISAQAEQFDTTSGNLAKLQILAKAKGLEPNDLQMMLQKFQVALAEGRQGVEKGADASQTEKDQAAVLQNFLGEKDTVKNFFDFIQSLKKVGKDRQVLIQQQIFGEKVIGKQSEFLNADFKNLFQSLGIRSSQDLTDAIEKQAKLGDKLDEADARRAQADIFRKAGIINEGTVNTIDSRKNLDLAKENKNIGNFNNLSALDQGIDKIGLKIDEAAKFFYEQIPAIIKTTESVLTSVQEIVKFAGESKALFGRIKDSKVLRGVLGSAGNSFGLK